jgi:hypothetical protein
MPPVGFRTHNLSVRVAADPRLRPRGHRDRHYTRIMKSRGVRRLWHLDIAEDIKIAYKIQAYNSVTKISILRRTRILGGNNQMIITTHDITLWMGFIWLRTGSVLRFKVRQ